MSTIRSLPFRNFVWMREKILNVLKLNRRKGIKELARSLIGEVIDKETKSLLKQVAELEKHMKNRYSRQKTIPKTKNSVKYNKTYTIELIK